MNVRRRTDKRATSRPAIQATDRRAAQRVPAQIMVRFSATDSFQLVGHGVVLDLSESGCKLCSALVLPVGSFWDLYLTMLEVSGPVLISKVQVVWARRNEYGIEFLIVKARERTRLRHFVWKRINLSTIKDGLPLFTLVDQSSSQRPALESLP